MSEKKVEKKVVSRTVVIGIAALCVVLLIALAYSVVTYTSMLKDKDARIAALSDSSAEISRLNGIIAQKDAELAQKNAEIDSLKAPKLIPVDLKSEDNRPWFQTPYVHVYGFVANVGTNTANNAKIHVVLYQSGGVIAKDTYIILGSVSGESYASVDTKVYYEGSEITNKNITLEWT